MAYPSLTKLFLDACDRTPAARAVLARRSAAELAAGKGETAHAAASPSAKAPGGQWEAITWREVLRRTAGLSRALIELGIRPGDRVALFSANRPEWHITDFAILGLGAVSVPIYFNESPERMIYILNDAGARVVVAIGQEQVRRLLEVREQLKTVEHVIVAAPPAEVSTKYLRYEMLIDSASDSDIADYRSRAALVRSGQVATFIYTSGTSGTPKGVVLTHANLASNTLDSVVEHDFAVNDIALSFLPLAHVYERTVDYGYLFHNVLLAYVEHMEQLPSALREVQPTLLAAVPRVFEKTYARILEREHSVTGFQRKIYDWAMRIARQSVRWRGYGEPAPLGVKLQWYIANALAYRQIRKALGGRLRILISGSAPLSLDLLEFFWSVDVRIYQGYGLTETAPIVSTNTPKANRLGSVGRPILNVNVRIADDGEVLVSGPCVMQGYHGKPEETARVLSEDGWLATGDIGRLDRDGFLYITDRKKDLIKTAAGKFVAPQPIENKLKASRYIANAMVLGDKQRFVIALLVPNFANVEAAATAEGMKFTSRREMIESNWTRDLIRAEIAKVNEHLPQWETVKRFALLDHDFTFEGGQLTYSMKVKRHVIEEKYAALIAQLYAEGPEVASERL